MDTQLDGCADEGRFISGSIYRGGIYIQYPVSNLTMVHIQMDMVLATIEYATHLHEISALNCVNNC